MSLDASVGNRAKEIFDLKLDYSSIFSTNELNEIRNILAFEITLFETLNSMSENKIEDIIQKSKILLALDDKTIHEKRIICSEDIKKFLKPKEEFLNYMIADDGNIAIKYRDNKKNKVEILNYKSIDGEAKIKEDIQILINEIDVLQKSNKKDTKKKKRTLSLLMQLDGNIQKNK